MVAEEIINTLKQSQNEYISKEDTIRLVEVLSGFFYNKAFNDGVQSCIDYMSNYDNDSDPHYNEYFEKLKK